MTARASICRDPTGPTTSRLFERYFVERDIRSEPAAFTGRYTIANVYTTALEIDADAVAYVIFLYASGQEAITVGEG